MKIECCYDLWRAMQSGTDDDSCYAAIVYETDEFDWPDGADEPTPIPDGYQLGTNLPALHFCPWCGTRLEPRSPTGETLPMKTITPTVGRHVWFFDRISPNPIAAIITRVISDTEVDLFVMTPGMQGRPFASVALVPPGLGSPPRPQNYCEWMPYQITKGYGSESGEKAAGVTGLRESGTSIPGVDSEPAPGETLPMSETENPAADSPTTDPTPEFTKPTAEDLAHRFGYHTLEGVEPDPVLLRISDLTINYAIKLVEAVPADDRIDQSLDNLADCMALWQPFPATVEDAT